MSEMTLPIEIKNAKGEPIARLEEGAAEGPFLTIRMYRGDIINVRNIQGGVEGNPNLDLGAGDSGANRGNVVVNWDVGNGFMVYDGRKEKILTANVGNDQKIHSHVKHRFAERAYFAKGAFVPTAAGGWKRLS